jgi:hypothetical protein
MQHVTKVLHVQRQAADPATLPATTTLTATTVARRCATASLAALLAACAGNGIGLDANGRPVGQGGGDTGALTADFASIQSHVFTPICTACHAGAAAPQGLRLDATNSYALLVGVPSNEVPSLQRVRPGDPGNSYIIQKLEGHAAVGAQMPLGGPYLDAPTIATIRQWISDGALAPPAAASGTSGAFAALVASPAPGDVLDGAPARLVLGFNAELDQTRIDGGSLLLERLPEGADGTPQPVAIGLAVPGGNSRALIVEPLQPLAPGRYRLSAQPAPATGLADLAGERLGAASGDVAPPPLTEFEVVATP